MPKSTKQICDEIEALIEQRITDGATDEAAAHAGAELLASHHGVVFDMTQKTGAVRVYTKAAANIRRRLQIAADTGAIPVAIMRGDTERLPTR